MKPKKGEALADELMDDLLRDDAEKESSENPKVKAQQQPEQKVGLPAKAQVPSKIDLSQPTKTVESRGLTDRPFSAHRGVAASGTEAKLAQSENLRIAQQKITDLENETERLRQENEQLAAAAETLRKYSDELSGRAEHFEKKYKNSTDNYESEKEILLETLSSKEKQTQEFQMKVDELETRLSSNIRRIRVRERELENRLELVRLENSALLNAKDESILDLKRQLDQLTYELENFRKKGQELNRKLDGKQEVLARTVKALRLALAMLETGEDLVSPIKKAN